MKKSYNRKIFFIKIYSKKISITFQNSVKKRRNIILNIMYPLFNIAKTD